MSMTSVLIISLAAGVILVVGGGLVMYMAQLVKNAYELKVQINSEVEDRLTKMGEDLDKKSRWIKRDLIEEIEKIKIAMETDNTRKFNDLTEPFKHRLDLVEETLRRDRTEWVKAFETDREVITKLDGKIGALRRDLKVAQSGDALGAAADAAAEALAAKTPGAVADDVAQVMAATAKPPGAAPAPTPAAAGGGPPPPAATGRPATPPPDPRTMSGFLPDLGKKR